MRLAGAVIGRRQVAGIEARVLPLRLPRLHRGYDGTGGSGGELPVDVAAAIRDRWALLIQDVIPSPGHKLIKVSRHVDGRDRTWTWLGYYEPAWFDDDRPGNYYGVGFAFEEAIVSGEVGLALERSMKWLHGAACEADRMTVPVAMLDAAGMVQHLGRQAELFRFDTIPTVKTGLSPRGTDARYRQHTDWNDDAIADAVTYALTGSDNTPYGALFFGNEERRRDRFYLPENEHRGDELPAQLSLVGGVGDSLRIANTARTQDEPRTTRPAPAFPDGGLDQRLARLETEIRTLSRTVGDLAATTPRTQQARPRDAGGGGWYQPTVAVLLMLILLILATGTFGSLRG